MSMITKKRLKVAALVMAFPLFILLLINIWLYASFHKKLDDAFVSEGPNAVWARHHWVGKSHDENEYKTFFDTLKRNRITDVYFHVGPWLEIDGGISPQKYEFAHELVSNARALYPDLRIHAWIGQMTNQGSGSLDLSSMEVRKNIVKTAKIFVDLGFDGIHYDFEPVYSGNTAFIDLLKRTQSMTSSKNRLLSIASGQVEIVPHSSRFFQAVAPDASIWTKDYFAEVSKHVNQIAVMLYDTGLPADWLYGMYVKKQVKTLVPLIGDETTLFIGVPTYENNRMGHRPWAENIEASITGIQHGLNDLGISQNKKIGISIFAEWTTEDDEWDYYRENWIGND